MDGQVDARPSEPLPDQPTVTRQSVLTSAVWNSIAAVLSIPILTLTTILLARILGAAGFGQVALYTFLIGVFGGLTELGVGSTILRRGAVAAGQGDEETTLAAVRAGTTWSLAQIPWTVLLACLVLPTWTSAGLYTVAALASFCFLGPSHYLVITSQLRVPSLMKLGTVFLGSGCTLAAALLTHRADITFGVASISNSALTFAQVFAVPKRLRRDVFRPGVVRISRGDIGFGLGNVLNGQLNNLVFSKSEILFFAAGQAGARGQFAASQTIAARSTLLADALLGNLSLGMASAFGRGQDVLRRTFLLVSDAVVLLFMLLAPVTLSGIAVLTEPVLGPDYHGLAGLTAVLGAMSLLQTSAAPLLAVRFAEKSIVPLITAGAIGAAVDMISAAVLVPRYEVLGAVIANAAGSVTYLVCTVILFRSQDSVRQAASSHIRRMALLLSYASLLPVLLLSLPQTAALCLAAPLSVLWTTMGLRLPALRVSPEALLELATTVLPARLGRVLTYGWVQRFLAVAPS